MNSFVILATNAQICSGHRLGVSVRKTSFKIWRASPDTVYSVQRWFASLSDLPAAMSGRATVTYSPVSTVTTHGLSRTQRYVSRLGSALYVMTVRCWGALMYTPASALFRQHPLGVRPFPPAPARFPTVGHPSCCFSVPIRTFFAVPVCLSVVHRHVSGSSMYMQYTRIQGLCQSRLSTADNALSSVAPTTTAV
jgi:hypothetical protein